jgi:DNA-binding winged helix-turn-helix (wHTH) protein
MVYAFGDCTLDTRLYALHRAGQLQRLRPKAFHVLTYLLEHRDRVVPKDELYAQVWPRQYISEATLESTIRAVRQAIGDSGQAQQLLQTRYGHGYRFVAPVTVRYAARPGEPASAPPASEQTGAESPPSAPLQAGEQKLVTILCCGVAQVAAQPGPPPLETLHRLLQALHALAWPEVQRYAGTLLPLTGDCLLAVFGAPVAHEDHAQRAVLAALVLQQWVQARHANDTPPTAVPQVVRLGLHTGLVAVEGCVVGTEPAPAIVGEPVGVAMTLQAWAVPGTIVCSETTARLVRRSVRLEMGEPVLVAGGMTPLRRYRVLGQRVWRTPAVPSAPRELSPFVGRARELALLQALLERVEGEQGQVVGIIGEPGLGKSRLVSEFRRSLRGKRLTYLAGSCHSYGQDTPYLPVLAILRHSCGITAADPPEASAAKVRRRLVEVDIAPEEWAPYLLRLLDVPMEPDPLATLGPQAIRARTVAALVQMARQGAHRQPSCWRWRTCTGSTRARKQCSRRSWSGWQGRRSCC